MRLINLHTLVVEEFVDSNRPPYVILSHTWGADEVSLQMLRTEGIEHLSGYQKILSFCRQGAANGFEWGWVDTCCIDKISSAELSEAINSMFAWYREADVCYAYLADVQRDGGQTHLVEEQFARSRWFTRGWTLQELLAPSTVVFYLSDWTEYGTKASLQKAISDSTKIPRLALCNFEYGGYSVAQKMSWAANRQTTRIEDVSYCLMGLFGVNMPLLYGEGEKAFIRLQEEIMKTSADLSIFAWTPNNTLQHHTFISVPLLAPNPTFFSDCGDIVNNPRSNCGPYSLTNKGVRIENLPLVEFSRVKDTVEATRSQSSGSAEAFAILHCHRQKSLGNPPPDSTVIGILLQKGGNGVYSRCKYPETLLEVDASLLDSATAETCYIWTWNHAIAPILWREQGWVLRTFADTLSGFSLSKTCVGNIRVREHNSKPAFYLEQLPKWFGFNIFSILEPVGVCFSKHDTNESFAVVFGERAGKAWIDVAVGGVEGDLPRIVASYRTKDESRELSSPVRLNSLDRTSKSLRGSKHVFASIVPGLEDGKRVFLVDVSVRDV